MNNSVKNIIKNIIIQKIIKKLKLKVKKEHNKPTSSENLFLISIFDRYFCYQEKT